MPPFYHWAYFQGYPDFETIQLKKSTSEEETIAYQMMSMVQTIIQSNHLNSTTSLSALINIKKIASFYNIANL